MAQYDTPFTGPELVEGIRGGRGAIRYDRYQSLSSTQKTMAKNNIGCPIPAPPTEDGTYTLKVIILNGVITYLWET